MHLEKIEIIGFKSFADRTVIDFSRPVTAVVGPNGCGKSNIMDAFRWVLGEGSAKSLRGDKMIDVIFSGTNSRKPLNMAQISVTFRDPSNRSKLGLEEICITRKLYRSGESEWYLNKNQVRLKDIHSLLWTVGLGKDSFYIFEQGKVDELITSSPCERRALFEEAAKIMHFKEQKKETLRKRERILENLRRIRDIREEVRKQIIILDQQALEANLYRDRVRQLDTAEKNLLLHKRNSCGALLGKKQRERDLLCEQREKIERDILLREEELRELRIQKNERTGKAKKEYERFFEIKKKRDFLSFERKNIEKKREEALLLSRTLRENLKTLHRQHLEEQKKDALRQETLDKESSDYRNLLPEREKIEKIVLDTEKIVVEESALRKNLRKELSDALSEENTARSEREGILREIDGYQKKREALSQEIKEALEKRSKKEKERKELEEQKDLVEKKWIFLRGEAEKAEETLCLLEKEKGLAENERKRILSLLTEKNARKKSLVGIKQDLEGYDAAGKKLLSFSETNGHPLFQKITPLTDYIQPIEGYERLISAILRPYARTLVVETFSDLLTVIDCARQENLRGYSLLCKEGISRKTKEAPFLKAVLRNPVSQHLLGNFASVETFSVHTSEPTVAEEEFLYDASGIWHRLHAENNNLFLRETELRNLSREVDEWQVKQDEADLALTEKEKILADRQQKVLELKKKERETEIIVVENRLRYEEAVKEMNREENRGIEAEKESHIMERSLLSAEEQEKNITIVYAEKRKNRESLEQRWEERETDFEKKLSFLKEQRTRKTDIEEKMRESEKRISSLREEIHIFEMKSKNFEERVEQLNRDISAADETIEQTTAQTEDLLLREKESEKEVTEVSNSYRKAEEELENTERVDKEKNDSLTQWRETLRELHDRDVALTEILSENRSLLQFIDTELSDRFSLTVKETHSDTTPIESIEKEEKIVKKLKKEIEGFTEINEKAIADAEAQKEREDFLSSQIDDLEKSQNELLEIIRKLDETSRRLFQETFEKIRFHFKENFSLLFKGGEADLQLTQTEDSAEAGIEIIAQPPGKKMRSLQLLSGGEKCLCAIALLFALFEIRSIPFCLLDEIDAPLDDSNIEKFTDSLKKFIKNNQFIIITHNKRTMAAADMLLGVSMQEKGVTKIIPLRFDAENKAVSSLQESPEHAYRDPARN